ncbi:unnamed protein product [Psylliodes chrysocephalus]|uniref:PPM-type phosphatase domain-containing protein n=1 Tax=Psylliodes chrysocephalus TaxID=3402493 RepID=A0A9P0G8R7_9CUCU|nr:unnamed protein product [Psylliodes chrysocephala]
MPSLRKRVSSYFRQLSFHNEPRDRRHNINENSFVTKYLQGHITLKEGPPIIYGKNPTDLPNYELGSYTNGSNTIIGCYSGPNGGLTTVKRTEKHLSVLDDDIDFIDTPDEDVDDDTADRTNIPSLGNNGDNVLPTEWNAKSEYVFGLSDSLYDRNQVTKNKNGDPIADCFGIIARKDSAILAVADGVNWGEKASIAAKSAVHGSLHYLNKTIFNDLKPFENLTIKTDESSISNTSLLDEKTNLVSNTREVFVCLLRAFNCAHDLILENKGMLTTLTVAVILPLRQKLERRIRYSNGEERNETETQYVCCVCNVGDTLAYVYSGKYGVRELTKGSHDVNSNRDMRDALGALGPVDGINPELSNLTLSITTLQKGDIVMVASDGLTDNFDPNVCKFTVNTKNDQQSTVRKPSMRQRAMQSQVPLEIKMPVTKPVKNIETPAQKPPIKPPRKSKTRDSSGRNSAERSSIRSSATEKSSSPSVENISIQGKNNNTSVVDQHSSIGSSMKSQTSEPSSSEINSSPINNSSNEVVNSSSSNVPVGEYENPLVAAFMRENSLEESSKSDKGSKTPPVVENRASSLRRQAANQIKQDPVAAESSQTQRPVTPKAVASKTLQTVPEKSSNSPRKIDVGYKFLRSKTTVDMRSSNVKHIVRNEDGVPYITPIQRYELQLLLMEDILKNGISGKDSPCTSAKRLCENLISYTLSITSAKRHTLEDPDLYFDNKNGILVEVTNQEKKIRRKKGLERVQNLPGKLDHVTIVAYNVGNFAL